MVDLVVLIDGFIDRAKKTVLLTVLTTLPTQLLYTTCTYFAIILLPINHNYAPN